MNSQQTTVLQEVERLEKEVMEKSQQLADLKKQLPRERVEDYTLLGEGDIKTSLSELFGDKDDLVVIHNMGKRCVYCTLWADGLNGMVPHFEDRAGLALVSPDAPEVQSDFARSRGWQFAMYSAKDSPFIKDMGFEAEDNGSSYVLPGFSTFHKNEDGSIERVAKGYFGPGDNYCGIWHIFNHLAEGVNGWQPSYSYQ